MPQKPARSCKNRQRTRVQRPGVHRRKRTEIRAAAAFRTRGTVEGRGEDFNAPEVWHESVGRDGTRFIEQPPGNGYLHPVTVDEVRERLAQLPARFTRGLEVVQFSRMTRKRALFPCYGMQWGTTVYLYPLEASLEECYVRPPRPEQQVEARMYGGVWSQSGGLWRLSWTPETVRDFYLNNVLIHEVGHINDARNTNFDARERYANWFAVEYGYRASRGRR